MDILQEILSRPKKGVRWWQGRMKGGGAKRRLVDSLERREEIGLVVGSQVEVTASKPWQTPTVSFHLHGQRLRSAHPAYLPHCRPGKAEREKCWAHRRSEFSFAPSLTQSPILSPAPYLPYCCELHWLAQTTPIKKREVQSLTT